MNLNFTNSGKLNDLIFENKNKNYGAYAIRKSQGDNLMIALFSSLSFFALIAFGAYWFSNRKADTVIDTSGNVPILIEQSVEIDVTPEKKIEKIEKPQTQEAPKSFSGQMTASDDKKNTLDKTTDDLNINKNPNPDGKDSVEVKKDIVLPFVKKTEEPEKIEKIVDQMPEFSELSKFIGDNLHYPQYAKDNGTQGTVYLTFVVEKDGSITDVKTLRGIGDGCEQEATRVVKLMPKWKPGINHNNPVRVQCTLPIKFTLNK